LSNASIVILTGVFGGIGGLDAWRFTLTTASQPA